MWGLFRLAQIRKLMNLVQYNPDIAVLWVAVTKVCRPPSLCIHVKCMFWRQKLVECLPHNVYTLCFHFHHPPPSVAITNDQMTIRNASTKNMQARQLSKPFYTRAFLSYLQSVVWKEIKRSTDIYQTLNPRQHF